MGKITPLQALVNIILFDTRADVRLEAAKKIIQITSTPKSKTVLGKISETIH